MPRCKRVAAEGPVVCVQIVLRRPYAPSSLVFPMLKLNHALQDNSAPLTIRHQNILTYPTLNVAQSETLMARMGTNAGSAVEIWNPRIKGWGVTIDPMHPIDARVSVLLMKFLRAQYESLDRIRQAVTLTSYPEILMFVVHKSK